MTRTVFALDYDSFVTGLTDSQVEQLVSAFWPSKTDWEKEIAVERSAKLGALVRAEYDRRCE